MLGGWSVRAVPMAAVDPYFDALHLGGLLAVLAGSALLYWLAASLLSRKARHLSPALGVVLLGAIAVNVGYFLPWARVESHRFALTLSGGDFGGAFGAGVLSAIAAATFLAAALSPVWDSSTIRVALGAVALGGGVGSGLLSMGFLRPDHSQIVAAFVQHGPAAFAASRHVPLAHAREVIHHLAASDTLRTAGSFGPYVVVAGSVIITAASALNVLQQLRAAFGRKLGRSGGVAAEGGPLARGRSVPARSPAGRMGSAAHGFGRPAPTAPSSPAPSTAPAEAAAPHRVVVVDQLPPAPPMPGGFATAATGGPSHLDAKWSAAPRSGRVKRLRGR